MATKAKSTKKTLIQVGDGATPTENFTTIAEIKSFDGPNRTAPDIDASSFDSDEMEFVPGLANPGEMQVTMNFVGSDSKQQQLESDLVDGTKRNYRLVFNDHAVTKSTKTFNAAVTAYAPSGQTNGIYEAKATLKISGTITSTYAPS